MVGTGATSGVELWRRRYNPKRDGCTSAQIDFVCVNVPVIVILLLLPLFLSHSLSVSLFTDTSHNNIAISLPVLLFFRSFNEVFVQTAFIPYYLSTDIDLVCVLCTSSSTPAVASLSLPLSLSIFVQGYLTQYRHFSTYPFIFSQLQRSVCTKDIYSLLPFWHVPYYFSICDHGPDSLHAVVCDKLTFFPLTGGCSEGLATFRFFIK